jgi:ketosteroid isomerase-like protein
VRVVTTLDDARAAFDRRRAAWLAEDLDAYMACWVDDMVIDVPGRTITGRDAYRALAAGSFSWARPVAFDFHHLAVDGDVVLADWTITVERRSDGAPVAWRGMSACALDADGLIVWWREYYEDPQGLYTARTHP